MSSSVSARVESVTPKLAVNAGWPPSCDSASRVAEAFQHADRLVAVEVGDDDHELLAAPARDRVVVAQDVLRDLGEHAQRAVAGLVAVGVVELLEAVEVGDRERERAAAA